MSVFKKLQNLLFEEEEEVVEEEPAEDIFTETVEDTLS